MNYRHIYHAGNIGDVLKHITQTLIIEYLKKKPAPFRVFDTHAGIGIYDLSSEQAQKTGEWQKGVALVLQAIEAQTIPPQVHQLLSPWLEVVNQLNPQGNLETYPGSPELAKRLLRKEDRLTLTELHPADFASLKETYGNDKKIKVIELDAWLALGSFLPPKERRGLVLIDPAFEVEDEFSRLTDGLSRGYKKWQTGVYAAWYPVKNQRSVANMVLSLAEQGVRNVLRLELSAGRISPDAPMKSSGMLIINPPYTLKTQMELLLPWLCQATSENEGAYFEVEQVIEE
ncbi:23S rRNA (adenine(2030)-N(6))-methyltransferase RlmJ [Polycladidibacter hongkongensis]|uniref:23S rRNA (adenine(2030)-N(6))-methyltransferase RlmJ n=1 Tax=Polycladidibacter hongkongensis TaxID=1647556 RepID=UPI0008351932|nr:23S rRNA (adenine(2030)-N(6))-methyltransferase RlmJ [Pseudovibrio hongkongensis]